jgi:peptide-methionine (S)-S-oxide reductase
VERVVVGYTGGVEPNPTYKSILDATEAVLIEYDPTIIKFQEVLAASLKQHNPFVKPRKRQHRSAIWVQNERQWQDALSHVETLSKQQHGFGKKNKPRKVYVDVEDVGPFYRAEEYHQDFIGKHGGIFE